MIYNSYVVPLHYFVVYRFGLLLYNLVTFVVTSQFY